MKFQQIRGATVKITYAGKCFLVDPFFADKDSFPPLEDSLHPDKKWPVVGLPLSPEEIIKDVDAVIITHLHPDHFDEAAAKALPKDIKLFAQDDYDAEHISAMGFTDVEVMSEEGTMFGSVALHRTECVHGVPELVEPLCNKIGIRAKASGAVFKAEGEPVLYLAGDTTWQPCVKEAIDKFSPDAIIVNAAGACFKTSGLIIMGTEDVQKVREAAPEACIIVSHMDAVPHASVSRADMQKFIEKKHIENILMPEDGETLTL